MTVTADIYTKTRVGFAVGVVSLATIGGAMIVHRVALLQDNLVPFCVIIGLAGLWLWVRGHQREMPVERQSEDDLESADAEETRFQGPFDFIRQPLYWGMILCLIAPLLLVLGSYARPTPAPQAVPGPTNKVRRPALPAPAPPPLVTNTPKREFPALKLQGVVCRGSNSLASISGLVVGLGEEVAGARVVAIDPNRVLLEFEGELHELPLPGGP